MKQPTILTTLVPRAKDVKGVEVINLSRSGLALTDPLLTGAASEEEINAFREHQRTGRPLGDEAFQKRLEKKLGRVLRRQESGPKPVTTK